MIRYSIITIFLLLASFIVQQFLPAFTGMHDSRILLVQLVRPSDRDPLGLPARERRRGLPKSDVVQAHIVQRL